MAGVSGPYEQTIRTTDDDGRVEGLQKHSIMTFSQSEPCGSLGSVQLLIAVLVAALGVAFAVYAGYDDSPGGVALGMAIIVGAVVLGVRAIRTRRRPTGPGQ